MILAAGLGTRLGPITRLTPKALVPVGGIPMLERVATRLVAAGADRLVINVHHHSDRIVEFVESRGGFGVEVAIAEEPGAPLETGGGLRAAAGLFRRDAPFLLHNVDVLTDLSLEALYADARDRSPLATLAVMERRTSRYLLFDDDGLLGRVDERKEIRLEARPARGTVHELAFAGVHAVHPDIFALLEGRDGAFSILDVYLDAVASGHAIRPFRVDGARWMDIGKPDQLAAAERLFGAPDDGVRR